MVVCCLLYQYLSKCNKFSINKWFLRYWANSWFKKKDWIVNCLLCIAFLSAVCLTYICGILSPFKVHLSLKIHIMNDDHSAILDSVIRIIGFCDIKKLYIFRRNLRKNIQFFDVTKSVYFNNAVQDSTMVIDSLYEFSNLDVL